MKCLCGHDVDYAHYSRKKHNGQKYDNVCVDCLLVGAPVVGGKQIDPWHQAIEKTYG